jgi:hypothetical protein
MTYRKAARDPSVSFEARALAWLIAGYVGRDGLASASQARLMKDTGWCRRVFSRTMGELLKAKIVRVEYRRSARGRFGRKSKVYFLSRNFLRRGK